MRRRSFRATSSASRPSSCCAAIRFRCTRISRTTTSKAWNRRRRCGSSEHTRSFGAATSGRPFARVACRRRFAPSRGVERGCRPGGLRQGWHSTTPRSSIRGRRAYRARAFRHRRPRDRADERARSEFSHRGAGGSANRPQDRERVRGSSDARGTAARARASRAEISTSRRGCCSASTDRALVEITAAGRKATSRVGDHLAATARPSPKPPFVDRAEHMEQNLGRQIGALDAGSSPTSTIRPFIAISTGISPNGSCRSSTSSAPLRQRRSARRGHRSAHRPNSIERIASAARPVSPRRSIHNDLNDHNVSRRRRRRRRVAAGSGYRHRRFRRHGVQLRVGEPRDRDRLRDARRDDPLGVAASIVRGYCERELALTSIELDALFGLVRCVCA